jgi:hypothetical protein
MVKREDDEWGDSATHGKLLSGDRLMSEARLERAHLKESMNDIRDCLGL